MVSPIDLRQAAHLRRCARTRAMRARRRQWAPRALGVQLHVLYASGNDDCDAVFATLPQLQAGALVIGPDAFLISRGARLGALALRHRVPAAFQYRPFAAAGGLMSYSSSTNESYRWVGIYVGRVLKGEKPSELPVQQVTKLELILNPHSPDNALSFGAACAIQI